MRSKYALKKHVKSIAKVSPVGFSEGVPHWYSTPEEEVEEDITLIYDLEVEGPPPEWVSSGIFTPEGEEIMVRSRPFSLGFLDFDSMDVLPFEETC